MLKERIACKQARVQERQRHLDTREELLERQHAAINELDTST
jgi:hypothetical protein